jgi:hypothetical protein
MHERTEDADVPTAAAAETSAPVGLSCTMGSTSPWRRWISC